MISARSTDNNVSRRLQGITFQSRCDPKVDAELDKPELRRGLEQSQQRREAAGMHKKIVSRACFFVYTSAFTRRVGIIQRL